MVSQNVRTETNDDKYIRGNPCAFRRLLKNHRDKRRWSQERLAAEAEMDHSLVNRLESGQRTPTYGAVRKLGKGLELSPLDLDQLLIAAGFFPVHPEHAITSTPVLMDAYRMLTDDSMPAEVLQPLMLLLETGIALARTQSEAITGHFSYRRA